MPDVTCDMCGAEVADLAHVCVRCTDRLRAALAAAPPLLTEVETTVARLARVSTPNGSRPTERPLPYNADAAGHRDTLAAVLTSWALLVADERGLPHAGGPADHARFLTASLEWLRHHPAGGDAVHEIRTAVHAVRAAVDLPPDLVYAGPCDACRAPLYARVGSATASCRYCQTPEGQRPVYDVQERRTWMLRAAEDIEAPAADIARAVTSLVRPIKPELIRTWAARDRIRPAGVNQFGRPVYRLGDVLQLMATPAKTGRLADKATQMT